MRLLVNPILFHLDGSPEVGTLVTELNGSLEVGDLAPVTESCKEAR